MHKEQKIEKGNKRSSQTKEEAEEEEVTAGEEGGATQHSRTHDGRNGIWYNAKAKKNNVKRKKNHRYDSTRATEGGKEGEI